MQNLYKNDVRNVMICDFVFQDLSRLGRDLSQVIIIDNSPASYIFHPDNAVSIHYSLVLSKTSIPPWVKK